ncbi:MAG: U32 family peptidase [Eubacteriales bacterium]|nr:U32 family peptidase [Eubacteriales bacterium]
MKGKKIKNGAARRAEAGSDRKREEQKRNGRGQKPLLEEPRGKGQSRVRRGTNQNGGYSESNKKKEQKTEYKAEHRTGEFRGEGRPKGGPFVVKATGAAAAKTTGAVAVKAVAETTDAATVKAAAETANTSVPQWLMPEGRSGTGILTKPLRYEAGRFVTETVRAPELLAPAGSMESFRGALAAGADAVYLAGSRFGARAYAANFTEEEIVLALREAHLFGRRVYLTVNTLTRQEELPELVSFVEWLAAQGLDGAIVQDLGVVRALHRACPELELHASTQMSVTGAEAVRFLKEQGVCRVVPAREMTLRELRGIREREPVALEVFIHGAMCYCYSGKCLFSSLIGGRSGNRGRCAQPCRLPYAVLDENRKETGPDAGRGECYPISMRDLCTIDRIPELIEAGIDSFKIEGRMKKPEYAAGVTAVYRKYIDRYLELASCGRSKEWRIEPEDRLFLEKLYLRAQRSEGYYHEQNGRDMETITQPGYRGADEEILRTIRARYLDGRPQRRVDGTVSLRAGERASLRVSVSLADADVTHRSTLREQGSQAGQRPGVEEAAGQRLGIVEAAGAGQTLSVTAQTQEIVQRAQNRPLGAEEIESRLRKSGESSFVFGTLSVETDGDSFLPVAALNRLRRDALEGLQERILEVYERGRKRNTPLEMTAGTVCAASQETAEPRGSGADRGETDAAASMRGENSADSSAHSIPGAEGGDLFASEKGASRPALWAQVISRAQWEAALAEGVTAVIDDSGAFLSERTSPSRSLRYLALPHVLREQSRGWMEEAYRVLTDGRYDGALVRTLEELEFLRERGYAGELVADAGLYRWNRESEALLAAYCTVGVYPYELNRRELETVFGADRDTGSAAPAKRGAQDTEGRPEPDSRGAQNTEGRPEPVSRTALPGILTVYGRLPMMITANCVRKTENACTGERGGAGDGFWYLRDRKGEEQPVRHHCRFCYNVVYNSVPLSLHLCAEDRIFRESAAVLCCFTTENAEESGEILRAYQALAAGERIGGFPAARYTTGHYRKGAE